MAGNQADVALVQRHYSKVFKVGPGDIKVRVADRIKVPGITVFSAVVDPAAAGRNITRNGIVEGGKIHVETDAMSRVARAWGYGPKRTVSAADFATVMGSLHSETAGSSAITGETPLKAFKMTASPKRAAAAALPAETTVDGLPAVVYSLQSEARSNPFSVVTAIVKPDHTVELRTQSIPND